MAGYAASARLQGGVPRFIGGGLEPMPAQGPLPVPGATVDDPRVLADPEELVGQPVDHVIADWLASVGESWSQLTFFLFDPDSWR